MKIKTVILLEFIVAAVIGGLIAILIINILYLVGWL